uniref:Uncharacterized protein n=1 Tax=Kalanchoe fedtschenkoi TaxID=63787 RepID=A0A7N0T3J8_KALFE
MFQKSGKTMKWTTLFKDLKEKVGLTTQGPPSSLSLSPTPSSLYTRDNHNAPDIKQEFWSSPSRDKHALELDFKRFWEDFRSSSSEKEKEVALNMTVHVFCRLVEQHANITQLLTMLVETHIFSFVVGRTFVTDVKKLKLSSRNRSLDVMEVLRFFSEVTEDGICHGSNLLRAVEVLVSGPSDKQSLLDSGILCCLIHILNSLLHPGEASQMQNDNGIGDSQNNLDSNSGQVRRLEIEGSVVHIMKALASHPSAAQSLAEDSSLQLLFQMVANGSSNVFSQNKDGLVALHTIQLHRHAMQILGLLLANDDGSTTKYIRKHQLIKVLLLAVKDFNPDRGDPAYTMGIVNLLLECVELSHRSEAGSVRLREDIHNAHGYQFLVQFTLALSELQKLQAIQQENVESSTDSAVANNSHVITDKGEDLTEQLSPILSRLLDILVNLAQIGPAEAVGTKGSHSRVSNHGKNRTSSADRISDDIWEKENTKVTDLEAVQMLQDIFLKADSRVLQAEVLNRMFKIFSGHLENYKLCQQLRTVPLFILNMAGFPASLQDIILKILEYAVTVVNCIPEQELLSLCCLLQQPITSDLKFTILSFFDKLLSFDPQYQKILREVGVLEVLLDDLKQNKFLMGSDQHAGIPNEFEGKSNSNSFKKHLDTKDAIISSPKLVEAGSGRHFIFEIEGTIDIAWKCMASLVKRSEINQASFRSSDGVSIVLPLLISQLHRQGVLRILQCLIIEDVSQVHSEELGTLVEVLKSGIVTNLAGSQLKLQYDAVWDTLGALWRIMGANNAAQRVFGEATGFSLLLTILHSFQSDKASTEHIDSTVHCKVFAHLMRVVTVGVSDSAANRAKLHTIISSQTFFDLLSESGLLCVECEKQIIQLMLELALEIIIPPFMTTDPSDSSDAAAGHLLSVQGSLFTPDKQRIYNAGAIRVLIRSLLLFTPKVQLELLNVIENLAYAGPYNQENLSSVGCVELLLETIQPFLSGSSPLLLHALKIVEVLGAYRLSSSELRLLIRYFLHMRQMGGGHALVDMMERLVLMEDMASENVSLAPFVEMDMSKIGHACVQVSLGERSWPPAAGYSFVCWFQFRNLLRSPAKEAESSNGGPLKRWAATGGPKQGENVLRIFSVGAADNGNTFYAELYIQENGVLTLTTSNSSFLSFAGLELDEGRWHHLAIVHSKPNALAGLFQASVAYVYLNGKLRHTGKLGYSPSPVGKPLQISIGTPTNCSRTSDLSWKLRSCYLFEEVLTSGCICFMYILGKGYRGLFQDTDLLRFVPNQACGGGSMAILDSLDTDLAVNSSAQKLENNSKLGNYKSDGSGIVWDMDRLRNLSVQISGKKLIFAFDGTCTEVFRTAGTLSMLNLVDPMSAAASPIGGIPRFGRLVGDIYLCRQCVIGDSIRPVGGVAVILALVEAAETRDMLHMTLTLLACALHQNPQNVRDMQTCRGYHLLALFLHRSMSLFDMHSLEIFFQIAACEASFSEQKKISPTSISPSTSVPDSSFDDLSLLKFRDEISSVGSHGDLDDFSAAKDSISYISEFETPNMTAETSNCIVLSDPDMVEHVLLDWTLWVTAPIPIQIALLGFLEHLVSMHWYRNHNLTILRRINLVQHLLAALQRGDVEVPVLEKLVVLLGVILEDGFLASELENVVRFVIMTFDPPILKDRRKIQREAMGKHVIVRNMLLEMLIDLQVTIQSEELLEQWHKIVSSKVITYLLDEAVHPTSMRWIMTLLGVSISFSSTFFLKFRAIGGYQDLARVLPSFYDSPDIYYILFCLVFEKPVYPRLPEVRMIDFHALMPSDGQYGELKFVELLDSVIAMAKSTFDRLSMQSMVAYQTRNFSQFSAGLAAELVDGLSDIDGDLQGEALMHKTYAARLMGGEASAPAAATSVLRFMVDLAKMCKPFSSVCRRTDFLEGCVDLYFSCVRCGFAVKMAKELSERTESKISNDLIEAVTSQKTASNLPQAQEQSVATSLSDGSFPQSQEGNTPVNDNATSAPSIDGEFLDTVSASSSSNKFSFGNSKHNTDHTHQADSQSSTSLTMFESPLLSERSNSKLSSPVVALASWLGSASHSESRSQVATTTSMESYVSASEYEFSRDLNSSRQGSYASNIYLSVSSHMLLEMDDSGYGCGPCSAGATVVLDFIAEVLADLVTENLKATLIIESILETVPLYVDVESMLIFQGLCLSRIMNFVERRLLRDDEEDEKRLDKSRWSSNLDTFCWMIVDRVYMGAFPQPAAVLKTLEFMLSMLQLANKDGRIEDASPAGKGLLSIGRGSRQLEAYMLALLKNTNRMILYCFLPSFLKSAGEDEMLSRLRLLAESSKYPVNSAQGDTSVDICDILQLLVAHRTVIFCPSNLDNDVNCCLCVNLISLLRDGRQNAQLAALDVIKCLLVHRRAALEDLFVSKMNQGSHFDILHGGFDKLLTENLAEFFEWLRGSEQIINKVLEQCAALMWMQYISGSVKFPGVRIKGLESRRKREMGKRSRDKSKFDLKHWEQINERRYALDLVRDALSTELRVVRQDKYGWVLHAESEWQSHLQQLVHERGIFPISKSSETEDPQWQICPIEGPYRMRKKLERCRLIVDTIQNILTGDFELGEGEMSKYISENGGTGSGTESDSFSHLVTDTTKDNGISNELYDESFRQPDDIQDVASARTAWNEDQASRVNDESLHSALDFGVKSSEASVPVSECILERSELGSPRQSSSARVDETKILDDRSEKVLHDNGEYLIRPYLEPFEKIRFRYNCERVVALDKHDGIFLIGEYCLYIIENFYIDESGCICEKEGEDDLSVIDQALGVKKDSTSSSEFQTKSTSSWGATAKLCVGGRVWAFNGGAWGKEKICTGGNIPHPWHMWKLNSVHEMLKRDYQLRPVAIEIFSIHGCNDLLVFHKKEREEVFKNLVAMNLPRNTMLDTTISGSAKQEHSEGSRLFKITAKSFSKRWQNGEISNFQYLMHLNTLAGRGYNDLTQYPVFPWVLADYESDNLDFTNPKTFRKLDKPMGCQTLEGEDEFKKRYESWDDPEVPKFHYGSHYSSAGIVLFYLLRLPPFSAENQKLQGGSFDHADRLFNNIKDTWSSAAGKGNTSDVKELIPEFFYMPEFLENRFDLDLGEKQSGEKVGDVMLPPWAKGSCREFIKKHREALESDYVSENLHNWIDLIFGHKQRGKAAEEAINVFYHYTYEGSVDIDSVTDLAMKASILAQINHFGQTPKQLFLKPHPKRRSDKKPVPHPLKYSAYIVPHDVQKSSSPITQIVTVNEKILFAGTNMLLKPRTYTKYVAWGFPDRSFRFISYDQDRLLSTHENLHGGSQIQCAGASHDGHILVTGGDDGLVCIWRITEVGPPAVRNLQLEKALCAHTARVTCLHVCQPYTLIVSGSDDFTVILWDLSSLVFVRQLPEFPVPVSALYVNDLTGEILTAAGVMLAIWTINGDCLAVANTSQLPSDFVLSVTSCTFSDWMDTNWYVTGHHSGAVKVWQMIHCSDEEINRGKSNGSSHTGLNLGNIPEYRLILHKVLKSHKHPVTALHVSSDLKQLLSGDSGGHLVSWTLPDESLRASMRKG